MGTEFSTVLACDFEHIPEFRLSMPTWHRHRPEMWKNPMLIFCDDREPTEWWGRQFRKFMPEHPDLRLIKWPGKPVPKVTQRHRMLSAFVYGVAQHCQTDWYFKIDSDTAAMFNHAAWWPAEWTEGPIKYELISSKWGYTKPAQYFIDACEWAKGVPALKDLPEVPGSYESPEGTCSHKRIISFVMLGRTAFLKELAEMHTGPLMPIPSQDGFVWYVCHRLGRPYLRPNLKNYGWAHNRRRLAKRAAAAMETDPTPRI